MNRPDAPPASRPLDGRSLGDRAVKAGVWTTSILVVGKTMGLIRSVLLARLLAPDDIGLFGITAVVLSLLTRFSKVGMQGAIVQKADDPHGYLDTAWTFNLARVTLLAAGLAAVAPWVAGFFDEPGAEPLVRVLGLGLLVQALASPGLPLLQRELEFKRRFVYMSSGVLSDLVISVSAAVVLRNAWALMLGYVGSLAVQMIVSYIIVPHRPALKWERSKLMELGRYGRWVFLNQVLFFLQYRADNFLVGKLFGAAGLGIYIMAYTMSEVAVTQIGNVTTIVAFPTFARAQDDRERVRRGFLMNVEWVFDVAFPSAVVIALCAPPLVNLALGPRWAEVATVLPFLAIASSGRTLVMLGNALMNGLGRPDLTMRMNLILVGITYALYVPTVSLMGLRGVGVALMVGQLVTLPIYATFVKRVISIPRREMLRRLVPGLLLGASVAAASLLGRIGTAPWVLVATLGGVGAVYVMVAWVLWRVRRVGPVMILQRLRSAYGR